MQTADDNPIGSGGRLYAVDGQPKPHRSWLPHFGTEKTGKKRKVAPKWREIASSAVELTGIAAISGGCAMIYAPAGLITGGVGLVLVGIAAGRDSQ